MAKSSSQVQVETGPVLAELIGTFLLTSAVLAAVYSSAPVAIPVVAGVTLTLLVLAIGPVSGAHVNPAVTLGLLSVGRVNLSKAVSYWVAQFAGALLALVVMAAVADNDIASLLPAAASNNVAVAEGLGAAAFLFGVAAALGNRLKDFALAFTVGFSLFLGILLAGVAAAGVINPAIALSLSGVGDLEWHYIVGPFAGAIVGAMGYKALSQTK